MTLIHENMSRGHTDTGWLNSYHTFSFGGFQDPTRMGFGALRVINEDRIAPGSGFSEHGHADMDILTLVLAGKLRHKDTLGNTVTIAPGEAQLMHAGSGVRHSEMNASSKEPAHFLQIWLIPDTRGLAPRYQQARLPDAMASRDWVEVAGPAGGGASLELCSDARLSLAQPHAGDRMRVPHQPGRLTFLHIIEGLAMMDGERLVGGDGVQLGADALPDLDWITDGKALLFDMRR
ncbi:pirin-like bicupin family protein [Rhizobium sp. CSW-27]|uniref:pirin family protein n=1 Tax=Rhizobium sp. CSW-27 TaxID=2839985 RepID=UPI001C01D7C4|nr:pirin-like bicupin family protein [Rhizobium sp. CSW-27]MBT9369862.1 pirin family protein [Rhizobium sp. CSW-27]